MASETDASTDAIADMEREMAVLDAELERLNSELLGATTNEQRATILETMADRTAVRRRLAESLDERRRRRRTLAILASAQRSKTVEQIREKPWSSPSSALPPIPVDAPVHRVADMLRVEQHKTLQRLVLLQLRYTTLIRDVRARLLSKRDLDALMTSAKSVAAQDAFEDALSECYERVRALESLDAVDVISCVDAVSAALDRLAAILAPVPEPAAPAAVIPAAEPQVPPQEWRERVRRLGGLMYQMIPYLFASSLVFYTYVYRDAIIQVFVTVSGATVLALSLAGRQRTTALLTNSLLAIDQSSNDASRVGPGADAPPTVQLVFQMASRSDATTPRAITSKAPPPQPQPPQLSTMTDDDREALRARIVEAAAALPEKVDLNDPAYRAAIEAYGELVNRWIAGGPLAIDDDDDDIIVGPSDRLTL